ncbi:MAG: rRNA maturation RNase YbeY [Pseudomonadota bacterium]|nr:rRNA maturation RNase YbeY [Pseudomonadota bacterium]MDE3038242.1 rRNA maturation RNase YbeY [Pseudomonadota bacterium]
MTPDIAVQLKSPRWKALLKPCCKTVRAAVGAALREASGDRCRVSEMTVVLAGDDFIRDLNRTYRGKNKPTNVLAFPHETGGDIILALETISREAKEQGKSCKDHAAHLMVHGTLHLLGYDHKRKKDAGRMEALEAKILRKLGVENPYL